MNVWKACSGHASTKICARTDEARSGGRRAPRRGRSLGAEWLQRPWTCTCFMRPPDVVGCPRRIRAFAHETEMSGEPPPASSARSPDQLPRPLPEDEAHDVRGDHPLKGLSQLEVDAWTRSSSRLATRRPPARASSRRPSVRGLLTSASQEATRRLMPPRPSPWRRAARVPSPAAAAVCRAGRETPRSSGPGAPAPPAAGDCGSRTRRETRRPRG
jgi:hypothetical protein